MSDPHAQPNRLSARQRALRAALAAILGTLAAILVACGGSSAGLIPVANGGPLQSDFEAVAQAAQTGNGNCTETEAALAKTEQDLAALPSSVDSGLRNTLHQGTENLRKRALALCAQPLAQTNTVPTLKIPTTPRTTPTTTDTTPTITTTTTATPPPVTTPTTTTPPGPGGGTVAPGETPAGKGNEQGQENGNSGGVGPGGAEPK
jgi:hypothetical protein